MEVTINYGINFSDYFYYDESSPTGLRWKVTITKGRGKQLILVSKGDVAGSFRHDRNGAPSQISVGLMGKYYRASRVIYSMFYGDLTDEHVVDHLDGNPFNNNITNLSKKTIKGNNQNKRAGINSPYGIAGVTCEYNNPNFPRFRARLRTVDYDFHKCFSIMKYGLLPAFKMAVVWRNSKITELNLSGADYTERHGK